MDVKILQLNAWKGKLFDNFLPYLKENHFDILHFQEVSGPGVSFSGKDNYKELVETLGTQYIGLRAKEFDTTFPGGYSGSAIFFHSSFVLLEEKVLHLNTQLSQPIDNDYLTSIQNNSHPFFEDIPRIAVAIKLEKMGKVCWFVNTQLAWNPSPDDTPKKIAVAQPILQFISTLKDPFVLAGDFNVDSHTKIVKGFETCAQNLNTLYGITNTLNERVHRAKFLFPPGLAVDFIMPKKKMKVGNFEVLDKDFSDHLGLVATLKI